MKKGYNTAFTFSNLNNNRIPITNLIKIMNDNKENPSLLRFSGGSLSFQYDISNEEYGNSNTNKYENFVNPKNYIYDFIELVKGLINMPKIVYCLNLHPFLITKKFDTIENCLFPLKFFKEKLGNDSVVTIELGNELYMYFIKDVKFYVELCELLIPKIREIFPNALISAPTESYKSRRGNKWNMNIMKIKGLDAISPHYYINTIKEANDITEYTKKISYIENSKIIKIDKKVCCTEYGFKYEKLLKFNYQREKTIIDIMENQFKILNYTLIIYHTLLMNDKSNWGKYIVKNKLIELR